MGETPFGDTSLLLAFRLKSEVQQFIGKAIALWSLDSQHFETLFRSSLSNLFDTTAS